MTDEQKIEASYCETQGSCMKKNALWIAIVFLLGFGTSHFLCKKKDCASKPAATQAMTTPA